MKHRKGRVIRRVVSVKTRTGRTVELAVYSKAPGKGATNPKDRTKSRRKV